MGKTHHHVHFIFSIALLLTANSVTAEIAVAACSNIQNSYLSPPIFSADELDQTHISADQTQVLNSGVSEFIGNVVIEQHQLRLTADNASYDKQADNVRLEGNLHADLDNLSIDASSGSISLKKSNSSFDSARFYFLNSSLLAKHLH